MRGMPVPHLHNEKQILERYEVVQQSNNESPGLMFDGFSNNEVAQGLNESVVADNDERSE